MATNVTYIHVFLPTSPSTHVHQIIKQRPQHHPYPAITTDPRTNWLSPPFFSICLSLFTTKHNRSGIAHRTKERCINRTFCYSTLKKKERIFITHRLTCFIIILFFMGCKEWSSENQNGMTREKKKWKKFPLLPLYETPSMFITCVIHKNEFQSMTNISQGTQAILVPTKRKADLTGSEMDRCCGW